MEVLMFLYKTIGVALSIGLLMAVFSCSKDNPAQPAQQQLIVEEGPSVADFDGNVYKTVKIGNQTWMGENLKSTHYSDGTTVESFAYNNDTANVRLYGRLYRWAAATRNAGSSNSNPSKVQGASSAGWHIPSEAEWQVLINNLGSEAVAGGKLKEAGTLHWANPNAGATNESKFAALPSGWFDFTGEFRRIGEWSFLTTATRPGSSSVYTRVLKSDLTSVNRGDLHPDDAIPIRCVKD
jgi:uncharacterized protein (TIGR02145 family)